MTEGEAVAASVPVSGRRNVRDSLILLGIVGALLSTAAWLVVGLIGVVAVVGLVTGLLVVVRTLPPDAVLGLYRATHVPRDGSQLSSLVDVLAYRAGLSERPSLYVVPSLSLNAFTTGRPDQPAIAVTEGLLRRLSLRELSGVIAHEMSHIRHNDLGVLTLADAMTRLLIVASYVAAALVLFNIFAALNRDDQVSWLAIFVLYLSPMLFSLAQLALSRTREFEADADAARITGDPVALADALGRIDNPTGHFWEDLMLPVPTRRVPIPSLLRSHPETEERIARLSARPRTADQAPLDIVEQPMVSLVGYGPGDMRPRYRWPGLWF